MANQTIAELDQILGSQLDRSNDKIPVWDASVDVLTTKRLNVEDLVTTGEFGTSGDEGSRVNRIVTLSQSEYDAISPKDPTTIYVIEDGYTVESTAIDLNPDPDLAAGTVRNVVALTQAQYDSINGDPATVYPNTLFVITDGKTKDSYVGQIDTPEDRTYIIDPKVVSARDISGFYCTWTEGASPAGTIDLQVGGTTVLSATHTIASGTTTFTGSIVSNGTEVITDAEVASGTTITLVLSGSTADITNFAFVVEYQS